MLNFICTILSLFLFLFLPLIHNSDVNAAAGDAGQPSLTWNSDPGCSNSGMDVQPRQGQNSKIFYFNAWSGLPAGAHCQAQSCVRDR